MSVSKVQLTGGNFQDSEGNVLANGYLTMYLSQDESVNDSQVCSGIGLTIQLDANGNVVSSPAQSVWGNDQMSPANSFYTVTGYTASGQTALGPNNQQVIGNGGTFDVGTWVPNQVISWTPPLQAPQVEVNGTDLSSSSTVDFVNTPTVTWVDAGSGKIEATASGGLPDIFLPESYGAVGNGITDDTVAIQAAITAAQVNGGGIVQFSAKTYLTTATLTVTANNVVLQGITSYASTIKCNSASVDILQITGTGSFLSGTNLYYNRLSDLRFLRSVSPSGTASGIKLTLTNGTKMYRVESFDSIYGFYHDGLGNALTEYTQCQATFTSTTTASSVYGWYIDGGNYGSYSGRSLDSIVVNAGSSSTSVYGMYITGAFVADLYCEGFETSLCHYGVYINALTSGESNYGESAYNNDNIRFVRSVHDSCQVAAYSINNLYGANSYVAISGGYVVSAPNVNTPLIDIENSAGVIVTGVNMRVGGGSTTTNPGIYINGSHSKNNVVSGNVFYVQDAGTPIVLNATSGNVVSDNAIHGYAGAPFTIAISLTGATNNTISGNNISGSGTTGISLDSSSSGNSGNNIVDMTSITNGILDAGVNTVTSRNQTPVNTQTISYTAVGSDALSVVRMNDGSANNFTVPPNSSVAFPIGTTLTVNQYGAGQTTIVAGAGVTINTPSSLTTRAQYSTVSVIKVLTDTWIAAGDLT